VVGASGRVDEVSGAHAVLEVASVGPERGRRRPAPEGRSAAGEVDGGRRLRG
jgi:hypothetical protein